MRPVTSRPSRRPLPPRTHAARAVYVVLAVLIGMSAFGPASVGVESASADPVALPTATASASAADPTATASAPSTSDPVTTATPTPDPVTTATPTPASTTTPAPAPTATDTPAPSSTGAPSPTPAGTPDPLPSPSPGPPPMPSASSSPTAASTDLHGGHFVIAFSADPARLPTYLAADTPLTGGAPFGTLRVRVQLTNAGGAAADIVPTLEYRRAGDPAWQRVPEQPAPGQPFHVTREWVAAPRGPGTVLGPTGQDLAVTDLRICTTTDGTPTAGHRSSGVNPDQRLTVPAGACTEEEFSIALSADAAYGTGYELRVTDAGTAVAGGGTAPVSLGTAPSTVLSPGQRHGADVRTVATSSGTATGAAYALSPTVAGAGATTAAAAYTLLAPEQLAPSGVHGPYSMTSDQCVICHSGHTAQGKNLLVASGPTSSLCLMCHDGTGATTDVKTEYALVRPANDDTTRAYYSHDALSPSTHTLSVDNEFAGVLNRHSDCADCHNAHQAQASGDSTEIVDANGASTGWSASGRLAGADGVAVANGAAGTAPAYTFLDGTVTTVTHEYQLCFACHSGYTTLPAPVSGKPSLDETDTAVEFNPNNPSFHPVEAAGTNKTPAMQASLDGPPPTSCWDFSVDGTVRCLNCHASSSTPDTTTNPGADLSPHTSANRGILIRGYQDRTLETTAKPYTSSDFALCYVCHGEEPFANASGPAASTATNFDLHGMHLTGLEGMGSGGTGHRHRAPARATPPAPSATTGPTRPPTRSVRRTSPAPGSSTSLRTSSRSTGLSRGPRAAPAGRAR